jgi:hypothetical protein
MKARKTGLRRTSKLQRRVFAFLAKHPGATAQTIRRRLRITTGNALYDSLRALTDRGMLLARPNIVVTVKHLPGHKYRLAGSEGEFVFDDLALSCAQATQVTSSDLPAPTHSQE